MKLLLNKVLETPLTFLLFMVLTGLSSTSYSAHVDLFYGAPNDISENPHDITIPHDSHWSWVNSTPPSTMTTVSYYIDATSGISLDQASRIRDAASIWSSSGALVSLVESSSPSGADIFINNDMNSVCGSFVSNNMLGCADVSYEPFHNPSGYSDGHSQHLMLPNANPGITFLTDPGLSWYAGAAGGIGASDFDYMTVAVHEFGHQLGVGHNGSGAGHGDYLNSPMQPFLAPGQEFRSLVLSDVDAIKHLYGVVPIPASVWLFISGLLGLFTVIRRKTHA